MKLDKGFFSENIKTLFYALVIAIVIRSLFIQPFYIPSSSMEPTLLVGDTHPLSQVYVLGQQSGEHTLFAKIAIGSPSSGAFGCAFKGS